MPDERHLTSMSDAPEIDRELASLLSIEASPEFAPLVRQRIRQHRETRRWRLRWWMTAAAAATIAMTVLVGGRSWRTAQAHRQASVGRDTVLPPERTPGPVQETPGAPARQTAHRTAPTVWAVAATRRVRPTRPQLPEILVSRDQLRAIARLRGEPLIRESADGAPSPAAGVSEIQPAPLAIAPLVVPPVDIVTGVGASSVRSPR